MIQEKWSDIEVKYLYVKDFKWKDPMTSEEFNGHPHQNRVYRALYNPKTLNYKVIIPSSNTTFVFESPLDPGLREISLDSIATFHIEERDINRLNDWIESDNEDLKKLYQPTQGLINLSKAMFQQADDEKEAMIRASKVLGDLWITNSVKFDIILDFIEHLTKKDIESVTDTTYGLALHKVHGLGVNITRSMEALSKYSGDDRRTNEAPEDLFNAMNSIVVELERKVVNGLE